MGDDLGFNNIQKHGEREVLLITNITNKIRIKGSDRTPFIFIFRLNIVLHNSYQADEIGIESEEWKHKVPYDYVKSFGRVLLGMLEASILS